MTGATLAPITGRRFVITGHASSVQAHRARRPHGEPQKESRDVTGRILIIDDDPDACELVSAGLRRRGFDVVTALRSAEAEELFREGEFDAVITDVNLGEVSGLELCRRFGQWRPDVPVVIMTGHGDMDMAIEAIRAGAYDFVTKPLMMRELVLIIEHAVEQKQLRDEVSQLRARAERATRFDSLIGGSAGMQRVYDVIEQVADSEATVLITGESGTGKELVARAIHDKSPRGRGPFVAINCAAMPATLLESELFGHVKGAFTDAKRSKQGLFVQATGGTLFLDEIGEMPLEMQAKLLRVLQERTVRPIGGETEIPFDTRIVSATNRDLASEVERGAFREDLYFRINVVGIPVPPLRSRGSDILMLAQHFLQKFAERSGKPVTGIEPAAAQRLRDYDWPGNVRELENCMERAVTLTRNEQIQVADLPAPIREHQSDRLVISSEDPEQLPTLEEMERRYLRRVLTAVQWNKSHAARVLGMDRRTLYRKLERHHIEEPS